MYILHTTYTQPPDIALYTRTILLFCGGGEVVSFLYKIICIIFFLLFSTWWFVEHVVYIRRRRRVGIVMVYIILSLMCSSRRARFVYKKNYEYSLCMVMFGWVLDRVYDHMDFPYIKARGRQGRTHKACFHIGNLCWQSFMPQSTIHTLVYIVCILYMYCICERDTEHDPYQGKCKTFFFY